MPPQASLVEPSSSLFTLVDDDMTLVEKASDELRRIKKEKKDELVPFPPNCFELMRSITGNDRCVDCGSHHPDWASVSYGALICMRCCGHHRSLGVQFSKVRSLRLDHWSHAQILKMLEGGNQQLDGFFERHSLSSTKGKEAAANLNKRYRTKAAKFYRDGIQQHVETVNETGLYRGRRASRRLSREKNQGAASMTVVSPERS
mmetsp:Transcript_5112/g.8392  ORF Transcript_5112/g.8392 Transcript_5112/m.8392 type:complete len:203 (-) Transcript_5112:291-899(-)